MAQIGTSWNQTSWAVPAWATNTWAGAAVVVARGNAVVPNTVARLGSLFRKTAYNVGIVEAPLAVRKFLDELKVERKRVLTEERKKLAELKKEVRKTEERFLPIPVYSEPITSEVSDNAARVRELEDRVIAQAARVREVRRQLREAEQARIDQLAEYARQEWMREEAERKAEAERRQREEDDTMQMLLLLVHEL